MATLLTRAATGISWMILLSGGWIAAATAVEARTAAHNPEFQNPDLWPNLSGKEYFVSEKWDGGRLYVWAFPGENGNLHGGRARSSRNPTDPSNWLMDGRPAVELIFDENTDLLLPASEKPYEVGFRTTNLHETFRHITVEPGAGFVGGGDGRGRTIYGNVWIQRGGRIYAQGATKVAGSRHTFFRNDNVTHPAEEDRRDLERCSQYFTFNKEGRASVEFRGRVTVSDEFRVHSGVVIVGRDSRLQPGRHAAPKIYRDGTPVLLDGAFFGKWCTDFGIPDLTVEGGTILGGLPDRPLTRNCTLGLSFKNHSNATFTALNDEEHRESRRVPSLAVLAGSTIRSWTADLQKAKLVLTYVPDGIGDRSSFDLRPVAGSAAERKALERDPKVAERFAWFDQLPRGLDCFLGTGVVIDGIELRNFRAGGILFQDDVTRRSWKNLMFGPDCLAQGEESFIHIAKLGRNGDY